MPEKYLKIVSRPSFPKAEILENEFLEIMLDDQRCVIAYQKGDQRFEEIIDLTEFLVYDLDVMATGLQEMCKSTYEKSIRGESFSKIFGPSVRLTCAIYQSVGGVSIYFSRRSPWRSKTDYIDLAVLVGKSFIETSLMVEEAEVVGQCLYEMATLAANIIRL
ncbi:hypothetical protein BH11ARM1_BH11ARM1_11630 [soil metagenome]